jgi:prolyl-tRNA synthetase
MGTRTGHAAGEPLRPVVAFLRGDHQVNENKLNAIAGTAELRPMLPEELEVYIGGPGGYLGPVGIAQVMSGGSLNGLKSGKAIEKLKGVLRDQPSEGLRTITVLDPGLENRKNLVAGANKLDYHFRNVTPGRDFTPTVIADIRNVNEGEPDPIGGEPLHIGKAVEVGHIFKLGCKYTESMGSRVLNADGKEVTPVMGCYGIGIERILTAAIESSAAANAKLAANEPKASGEQYALPPSIAPYHCVVTITNVREAELLAAGEKVAAALDAAGMDTLLDDRDERAGVKFKDAELIGIPYRINIGKKLAEGLVELVDRLTHTTTDLPIDSVAEHLSALVTSKP